MNIENFGPFHFARLGSNAIRDLAQTLDKLITGHLWAKILFSLVLGIIVGIVLGPETAMVPEKWSKIIVLWLALPGQLFLSLIQLVIIPLIFASVVLGIISSDSIQQLKSLGFKIGIYYVLSTVFSVGVGFFVAYLIRPGRFIDAESFLQSNPEVPQNQPDKFQLSSLNDVMSGLIPSNPFNTLVSGEMLQVVFLALFTGVALMSLKNDEAKPLVDLLNSFQKISMTVISWAMNLAPLAVFGLTARLLAQLGWSPLVGLGFYILTVLTGLFIINFTYVIMAKIFGKIKPLTFLSKIKEVQLLAFSTSSSASVMPLTIETAEKKLNIKPSISQFVIPLGTTINMDGTAMYQGVATLFLAQAFNVDLSFGQLSLVVLTATLSSIGSPGAPGVGIAVLSSILANVGIPSAGIVLIIGVDRILDMCRTVTNVTGDLTAAVVMNSLKILPAKNIQY